MIDTATCPTCRQPLDPAPTCRSIDPATAHDPAPVGCTRPAGHNGGHDYPTRSPRAGVRS